MDARQRQVRKCWLGQRAPGQDQMRPLSVADSTRCSAANIPHLRASASAGYVCAHNPFCMPAVWATCSCFSRLVALLVCTALASVVCSGVRAPQTHTHTHIPSLSLSLSLKHTHTLAHTYKRLLSAPLPPRSFHRQGLLMCY